MSRYDSCRCVDTGQAEGPPHIVGIDRPANCHCILRDLAVKAQPERRPCGAYQKWTARISGGPVFPPITFVAITASMFLCCQPDGADFRACER